MRENNVRGFFKALKSKKEMDMQREKVDCSAVQIDDKIQFVITVQHFKFLFDRFDSRLVCNNPEDTIILDDEDIAYFKNKYKDLLQQELAEEITNLKKQYEL